MKINLNKTLQINEVEEMQDGHYPACAEQPQGFPCRCDQIADELRQKEIEAQIEEVLDEYEKN